MSTHFDGDNHLGPLNLSSTPHSRAVNKFAKNGSLLALKLTILLFTALLIPHNGYSAIMGAGLYQSKLNMLCLMPPISQNGEVIKGGLRMWSCGTAAKYKISHEASGIMKIGGYCVDAEGNRGKDGDYVGLWECNGQQNQVWYEYPDGTVRGINGKCLDINMANTRYGARLVIWQCNGGMNQQWRGGERLGYAYVFFRENTPPIAGHVGWGIFDGVNRYLGGTVDGTGALETAWTEKNSPGFNWYKEVNSQEDLLNLFKARLSPGDRFLPYTRLKRIPLVNPDYEAALKYAKDQVNSGYLVFLHNCFNRSYEAITRAGVSGIYGPNDWAKYTQESVWYRSYMLFWGWTQWFPVTWFNSLPGTPFDDGPYAGQWWTYGYGWAL